jgi:hypothetical protein
MGAVTAHFASIQPVLHNSFHYGQDQAHTAAKYQAEMRRTRVL